MGEEIFIITGFIMNFEISFDRQFWLNLGDKQGDKIIKLKLE